MATEQTPRFDDVQTWKKLEAELSSHNSPTALQRIRKQTLAQVAEWRWADGEVHCPTPFFKELYKFPAGKWLKDQTKAKSTSGAVEHGLNADGSVLVMRSWPSYDRTQVSEQIIVRRANLEEVLDYSVRWPRGDTTAAPQKVTIRSFHRYHFESGHLVWHQSVGESRALHVYHYREGRLETSAWDCMTPGKAGKSLHLRRDYRYTYQPDGQLESIASDYYRMPEHVLVVSETHFRRKNKNSSRQLMRPRTAKKEFEKRLSPSVKKLAELTPAQGIRLMFDFYKSLRAEDCPVDQDGDMLLFQWGTRNQSRGTAWQCDITRQFTVAESLGDDGMSQLSLTFHFVPSAEMAAIPQGNRWCNSPDELADFEALIKVSDAYRKRCQSMIMSYSECRGREDYIIID